MIHTCTKHAPGAACYTIHRCRCDDCRKAATIAKKRSRARCTDMVDSTLVRAHIDRLRGEGWTYGAISRAAGLGSGHARSITMSKQVHATTARAIMGVATGDGRVDAAGTRRRIEALLLQGWTYMAIGERLGVTTSAVFAWSKRPYVAAATRDKITRLADELCGIPGPSKESSRRALRRGAVPLLAWDEGAGKHGIDNPDATPYKPAGGVAGARREEAVWLREQGLTTDEVATRLGIRSSSVEHALYRAGRPDLAKRVA